MGQAPVEDPIVSKYVASGLNREAATLAVSKYGDDPAKVHFDLYSISLLSPRITPCRKHIHHHVKKTYLLVLIVV